MKARTTESQEATQLFDKLVDGDEQECQELVTEFWEGDGACLDSLQELQRFIAIAQLS